MPMQSELINGPAGLLEMKLESLDSVTAASALAVVAHPHPQHGGTMDNKVVYSVARELAASGLAVARFNFRGVGQSEGAYDEGRGEVEDLLAVLEEMQRRFGDLPVWLAGFSFGGYVAARASALCAVQQLCLVAPAVSRAYFDEPAVAECAGLLIHGDQDQLIEPQTTRNWADEQPGQWDYRIIEGADHFFHGKLSPLREAVRTYVTSVTA